MSTVTAKTTVFSAKTSPKNGKFLRFTFRILTKSPPKIAKYRKSEIAYSGNVLVCTEGYLYQKAAQSDQYPVEAAHMHYPGSEPGVGSAYHREVSFCTESMFPLQTVVLNVFWGHKTHTEERNKPLGPDNNLQNSKLSSTC